MKYNISAVAKRGLIRRLSILAIVIALALLSGSLFFLDYGGDLGVAAQIFVVSLAGFSVIAFLTSDAVRVWRAVDYLWVSASFVALICALAGIAEQSWKREVQSTQFAYRAAVIDFSDYFRFLHGFYCRGRSYDAFSDLQKRICDAIPDSTRFLDRLSAELVEPGYYEAFQKMAPILPFIDNILDQEFIRSEYTARLRGAEDARKAYLQDKSTDQVRRSTWSSYITTTGNHYWYFILAFFVGLRLSRTTAELLQARKR